VYHSLLGDFESPQAEAFYVDVLRRMAPEQKWQAAISLWVLRVEAAGAHVRAEHPDWPETQVHATVARRILEWNGGAARLPEAGV
jgi:hypothetical protein